MKFRIVTTLLLLAVLAALELWGVPSGDSTANATSAPSTPSQTSTPPNGSSLGGVRIF
jgi:hypothetical protein